MMRDYTNQMRKIELRTKEAEKRAADAMTQVYFIHMYLCTCWPV